MLQRPQRLIQLSGSVFTLMDDAKRRAQAKGLDVINLSVGSPDLPPAPHIIRALQDSAGAPSVYGYPLRDLPEYRRAVAGWYARRFGVQVEPESQVVSLMGSQEGLAHFTLGFCDPGDVVLVPDPGYPIYLAGPVLMGAQLYPYPLRPENGFVLDPEDIPVPAWRKAKVLLINYPSNPLSAVAGVDFFARIVEYAKQYNVAVLHDAAYSELTFDGYRPPSFLEAPGALDVGLELNSLSKTFNMAGARVAYAIGNPHLISLLAEAKGHLDYGLFEPIQRAAIAALDGPQECVTEMAATYQARRDALVNGLRRAGWDVPSPPATMFLWAPVPGGRKSLDFVTDVLERTGVVLAPGSGFGRQGEGYVRIALVQPAERLAEAAARLGRSGVLG